MPVNPLTLYARTMADRLQAPRISSAERDRIQRAIDQGFTNIAYHSTPDVFPEIDLNYTDVGFHAGTPAQARNRALDKAIAAGLQTRRSEGQYIPQTSVMPLAYRPGPSIMARDVGEWKDAYTALLGLRTLPELRDMQDWMDESLEWLETASTPYGGGTQSADWMTSPENLGTLGDIRQKLLDRGIRQIEYPNEFESEPGLLLPQYEEAFQRMDEETQRLYKKALSAPLQSNAPALGASPEEISAFLSTKQDPLDFLSPEEQALYKKYRNDMERIQTGESFQDPVTSRIFLDPADIRSVYAPFAPEAAREVGLWKKEGGPVKFGTGGLARFARQAGNAARMPSADATQQMAQEAENLRRRVYAAYESGDYDLAETLDAELDTLYETLDSRLAGADDVSELEIHGESDWDQIENLSLDDILADSYASRFVRNEQSFPSDEAFMSNLRESIKAYGGQYGDMRQDVTDRQVLEAAKEAYEIKQARIQAGRERMIGKADGGPVYDPSRVNQLVEDLLDPMYEFEPYDDEAYEAQRFQKGGLAKAARQWLKDVVEEEMRPYRARQHGMSVEDVMKELQSVMSRPDFQASSPEARATYEKAMESVQSKAALNAWLGGTATKYLKRDFGTEFDPMRDLSTRHVQSDVWPPRETGPYSEPARAVPQWWKERNQWLEGVDPETPIYMGLRPGTLEEPGLNIRHLRDELMNAMSAEAGLPRNLQIRPESLQRMSFPQASELVGKINKYREDLAAQAATALRNNSATVPYRAYETVPGTTQPNVDGLRWVQLRLPEVSREGLRADYLPEVDMWRITDENENTVSSGATRDEAWRLYQREENRDALDKALEFEGEQMGHSVAGYRLPERGGSRSYGLGGWDALVSGKAQLYSLRDAQGLPHVTIEAGMPSSQQIGSGPLEITQIKGKQNQAPVGAYLPYVQDFVRSGNWNDVRELENARLRDMNRYAPMQDWMKSQGIEKPRYLTEDEYQALEGDFLLQQLGQKPDGMKKGGKVKDYLEETTPGAARPLSFSDLLRRYTPESVLGAVDELGELRSAFKAGFDTQYLRDEGGLPGLALSTAAMPGLPGYMTMLGGAGLSKLSPEAGLAMLEAGEAMVPEFADEYSGRYDEFLNEMLDRYGMPPTGELDAADRFALAAGEMLGQVPMPAAWLRKLGSLKTSSRIPKAAALATEYFTPVVDPKLANYAVGTAIGGGLRQLEGPEELDQALPDERRPFTVDLPPLLGKADGGLVYDPARIESMVAELFEPQRFAPGGLAKSAKSAAKSVARTEMPEAERRIITEAVERELALPPDIIESVSPQRRTGYGRSTIRGAQRKLFPGIYEDPREIVERASARVAPESAAMERLFGVTREDLSDIAMAREPTLYLPPGAPSRPRGTDYAELLTRPANTQRLQDILYESMDSPLRPGMTGWYIMDPAYKRLEELVGPEEAARRYMDFTVLSGIHSANAPVESELIRGSALNWLNRQGRLDDYVRYGGKMDVEGRPEDMRTIPGHYAHKTAHLKPSLKYLETGQLSSEAKTPAYMAASLPPELGTNINFPIGDAHYSRAIGLADVRPMTADPKAVSASWSMPEAMQLHEWFANEVARPVGLAGVPAQALLWGAASPITGVKSLIGSPKLEILADQIMKTAKRLNITPEEARDLVLMGEAYAGKAAGGLVTYQDMMGAQ
jgi:hypothetical protein